MKTMLCVLLSCSLLVTAISSTVVTADINEIIPCNMSRYWNGTEDWKFLMLTMSWPETFCLSQNFQNCSIPQNVHNWTIHGLWPSTGSRQEPANCSKTATFDSSKIKGLMDELNKYWPDLIVSGNYYLFWTHEWCKHGTCASNVPTLRGETNYFNKTLQLYQKFNPYRALSNAGITPSDTKTYHKMDIVNTLTSSISAKVDVDCYRKNTSSVDYLHQVFVCLDKSFHPVDCPKRKISTCSDIVTYPSIHHDSMVVQKIP